MSSDHLFLERDATADVAASAPAGELWIAPDAVAATPADDNTAEDTGGDEEEEIAFGPSEGPFAEGLWRSLRWWVHQLMVVFHHPEQLPNRPLNRRDVRLLANWLRGIEGFARRLLVTAAANLDIGKLPKLRPGKKASRTVEKSADGKRRCSFRALNWRQVCHIAPVPKTRTLLLPPAPQAPPQPRRVGKRKSRYHPEYNPHYRDEFDPPPPVRLRLSRIGQKRPKKIDDNPWKIFPPDPPPPDDGKRWSALPYARRIEALRWLVYEPERAARRLALRIARRRDGWSQLALIRDPVRGKTEPPAWRSWFDAHIDAKEACLERWKQAHAALADGMAADTS